MLPDDDVAGGGGGEPIAVARTFLQHRSAPAGARESVCSLAISADGQWAVTADLANNLHVFNLDSLKYHSTLPVFDSQHTALFVPRAPAA
jgi:hypothetical protein